MSECRIMDYNQNDNVWVDAENIKESRRHSACTITSDHEYFRTSTPNLESPGKNRKASSYYSWKKHLSDSKVSFKVRGANISCDEIISGHINTSNIHEQNEGNGLPIINEKFINLILNSPDSKKMICTKYYNYNLGINGNNKETETKYNCYIYCVCNECSQKNINLPIGYKFHENGIQRSAGFSMR